MPIASTPSRRSSPSSSSSWGGSPGGQERDADAESGRGERDGPVDGHGGYKRRLVMTCVGIAGCTALLLTGLGLQNSINDIIDVQYGELVDYNVVISEKDDAADAR